MKLGTQLVVILMFYLFVSILLVELGIGTDVSFQITVPSTVTDPSTSSNWWTTLSSIVGIAWGMIKVFIKMLAFQVPEVPPMVVLFVFYPLNIKVLYNIYAMIRGGGLQ